MAERLASNTLAQELDKLDGWTQLKDRDAITKHYKFKDFNEAFAFMTYAALVAETMNHHPEWSNIYNNVDVTLTTHDAGGVTELDIRLAQTLDAFSSD